MTQTSFHQRLYWADRANGLLTDMADHFKRLEAMEKEVSAIHEKVNGVCLEALDAEAFNEHIQLTGGCFRIIKGIDDYQDKVIVVAKKICDLVRAAYNMPYTDVKAIKSVTEGYEAHKQVATVLFDRLRVSTNDLVKQYAAAQCQHLRRKLGQGSDGDAMTEVQAIMSQLSICVDKVGDAEKDQLRASIKPAMTGALDMLKALIDDLCLGEKAHERLEQVQVVQDYVDRVKERGAAHLIQPPTAVAYYGLVADNLRAFNQIEVLDGLFTTERVYGGEERDAIMAPVHQSMRQLRQLSETLCDMIQAYVEANCKRVAIHGDGSCLFRSITRGLDRPETEHFKLRKAILKYLGEHLDKYALTIEDVIATEYANAVSAEMRRVKTVRDYLQHMQRSTSYGDRPEILAAAEIFQAAIVTVHTIGYGADKRYNVHEIVIPSELSPKRPVIFLNHTGAQHYNVLLPDLEKLTENVKLRKEQEEEQAELSCEEVDDIV